MPRTASGLPAGERAFLLELQTLALGYFLDNQAADGLVLDRQANFGPPRRVGQCSTAAAGMGFIALALASAAPFRLLTPAEAAPPLGPPPHPDGLLAPFTHPHSRAALGCDPRSTVDSAWLLAGGLWAAAFLDDPELLDLAGRLYDRVDWRRWTDPASGLLRHGR